MTSAQLSSSERKLLKRQTRFALILGIVLFAVLTAINLVLYYHDLVTGIEGVERPPVSQLIIVEVVAVAVGVSSYYFPSKKWLKDLSNNQKHREESTVHTMFVKNNNGMPEYTLRLMNKLLVVTDKATYGSLKVGDRVAITYAPASAYVFHAEKAG